MIKNEHEVQRKDPSELSKEELEQIVRAVQDIFYLDEDPDDNFAEFWNPDKEWDSAADYLDILHDVIVRHRLDVRKLDRA